MEAEIICGYCMTTLENQALDEHLPECEKEPWWTRRRRTIQRVGLEREGWDIPPDAA